MWGGNWPFSLPWQPLQVSFFAHTPSKLQQYCPLGILTETERIFFNELLLIILLREKKKNFHSFFSPCYGTKHLTGSHLPQYSAQKQSICTQPSCKYKGVTSLCRTAHTAWEHRHWLGWKWWILTLQVLDKINYRLCKNHQLFNTPKVPACYKSCNSRVPLKYWFF